MTVPSGGTAARKAAQAKTKSALKKKSPSGGSGISATRRDLDPDRLVALEEERKFLLGSLSDLEREHDAGDVDDVDYEILKDDYTARAAAAIRAIEDRDVVLRSTRPKRDWRRTASALVLVGVVAVGTGWVVFRNAGTRSPGQGLTGNARQDSSNLILQAQGLTGQAQQSLQAGDTKKAIQEFNLAIETYNQALELSPGNVQAMTYAAWVRHSIAVNASQSAAVQLDAEALAGLTEALSADPTYADARVFRAILRKNLGDFKAAQADLDAVDMAKIPAFMTNMVDAVRRDVAAGATATTAPSAR